MRRLFTRPIHLLNVANGAALAGGTGLTILAEDPHGLMRTGAFLAAVTGMFVVWQVREEIEMERSHHVVSGASGHVSLTPLDRKAEQLETARLARRDGALRQARLAMVLAIAIWLFVGELLHGFGDIIYRQGEHVVTTVEGALSRSAAESPSSYAASHLASRPPLPPG